MSQQQLVAWEGVLWLHVTRGDLLHLALVHDAARRTGPVLPLQHFLVLVDGPTPQLHCVNAVRVVQATGEACLAGAQADTAPPRKCCNASRGASWLTALTAAAADGPGFYISVLLETGYFVGLEQLSDASLSSFSAGQLQQLVQQLYLAQQSPPGARGAHGRANRAAGRVWVWVGCGVGGWLGWGGEGFRCVTWCSCLRGRCPAPERHRWGGA